MSELKVSLKLGNVNVVDGGTSLQRILEKHSAVFTEGLGCLKGMVVKFNVDTGATPKFYKARTVPLALKHKVEEEIDKLESMGIISQVQFSSWAAPVLLVVKQNGGVRLCEDYKISINQASPVIRIHFLKWMSSLPVCREANTSPNQAQSAKPSACHKTRANRKYACADGKKGISQTASSKIQRWALTLSAYQYTIRHKTGVSLSNADALSRLP